MAVVFAFLGLRLAPATPRLARRYGLIAANPISVWLAFACFYFIYRDAPYEYVTVTTWMTTSLVLGPAMGVVGMMVAHWIGSQYPPKDLATN
jgi:hypothetical protein